MQLIFEISRIFLSSFLMALFMPIFWIVLFLVYLQYRRQVATEEKLFGRTINQVGRQILLSVGLGIIGGFAASAILLFLGLSLEQIGLYFIWPVALLLLLFNPRYLCFSYAGGIVAAAVLVFRHILVIIMPGLAQYTVVASLLRIHIPALLVLIGLLHLIEALLIYIGGHWGSSPIYLKNEEGRVVGAFSLQRFWPIPLVALLVSVVAQAEIVGVSMPEWWPILQSTIQPGVGQSLQYAAIPVAAGLGYADMALSSTPRERSAFSAKWLAVYSTVLLIIAIGSAYTPWLILPGVLFAPLGHEILILYGNKKEQKQRLRYEWVDAGVSLMMVLPGTAAQEAGLADDDLILKVNGHAVADCRDMMQKIEDSYFMVLLEGLRKNEPFSLILKKQSREEAGIRDYQQTGMTVKSSSSLLHHCADLGLIPVPTPDSPVYLEIRKPDPLGRFRRMKSWIVSIFHKLFGGKQL